MYLWMQYYAVSPQIIRRLRLWRVLVWGLVGAVRYLP